MLAAFEDRYTGENFGIGPVSIDLGYGLVDSAGADVATGSDGSEPSNSKAGVLPVRPVRGGS